MREMIESRRRGFGKGAVLAALTALLVGLGPSAIAQTDTGERVRQLEQQLEQLKADIAEGKDIQTRLEALEQELANLKQEIAAGGQAGPTHAPTATPPPGPTPPATQLPPAGVQGAPNPLQDDRRYLTGQDLLDESFPNSLPIPGTQTRFAVGGYAKLDFIHDLDFVGDRYEFELSTIPVAGTPDAALGGRTSAQAKESRINFDFRRKVQWKNGKAFPLQAFLEIDFFDDRESFGIQPRLRHAYGVIGRLLAGRTWNASGDLEALAGTIDFSGGDALYGDRVAQVRWQDRIGKHVTWSLGVEDPKNDISNPLGLGGRNRSELPNLGGHIRWTGKGGSHVQLGGDLFRLDWQGGDAGPSDTEVGYGVNLTARWLPRQNGTDAVVGGGTVGRGSGHRVVPFEGGGNDAVITPGGLDVLSHWQAYVGYSHYWTKSLNSTISTNWAELDNSEFQPASAIHRVGSFHLNLIWFPYKLVSTGIEVMWGERVNKDGARGEAWRLQYMAKYKFN